MGGMLFTLVAKRCFATHIFFRAKNDYQAGAWQPEENLRGRRTSSSADTGIGAPGGTPTTKIMREEE